MGALISYLGFSLTWVISSGNMALHSRSSINNSLPPLLESLITKPKLTKQIKWRVVIFSHKKSIQIPSLQKCKKLGFCCSSRQLGVFYYDGPGALTPLLGFRTITPAMLKAANCTCAPHATRSRQAVFVPLAFLATPHTAQVSDRVTHNIVVSRRLLNDIPIVLL